MLKAIKIKLYPTLDQQTYCNKLLGTSRFIYNNLLAYKIQRYNDNKQSTSFKQLGSKLVSLKTEFPWIKEAHSKVLQQSLLNLKVAYKSFFKNGTGFPNFKNKKNNKQSCRFPIDAIGNVKGNRITIIKQLKDIHFKCSRRDEKYLNKHQSLIHSATLTKTRAGQYILSILIDKLDTKILPSTNKIIGIDLGIKDFVITSDNTKFKNIKVIRNNQNKLAKLHRNLSRKQPNSKNKEKARIKLAKFHEKLTNIKEYYLHSISNQLLTENQVIVMEDLSVKNMMKNHNLARSIQELSLCKFKSILQYKASWYNRDIILIDKFFPSTKLCSDCGYKNDELTLSNREWGCPSCGVIHDRDFNAATNIKNEGQRILQIGMSSPKLTTVKSNPSGPRRSSKTKVDSF